MSRIGLLTVITVSVLFCSIASAQSGGLRFSLTDLNRYFKGTATWASAYGINENGQVVGTYVIASNQYCFAYKAKATTVTAFTSSATPFWCDGRAINVWGDVAGTMHMSNGLVNAFLRTSAGAVSTYASAYGFNSFGWGIDNSKNVVGESDEWISDGNYSFSHGVTWSANPSVPPGYFDRRICAYGPDDTIAYGTDPAGKYVAVLDESCDPDSADEGYTFQLPTGPWAGLAEPCWNHVERPFAVNSSGHVAGEDICWDEDEQWHAVLWTPTQMIDLGSPSYGLALSSDDWVVGWSGAWMGDQGFLRVSDPNCPALAELTALLDRTGAGWTIVTANGINSAHQIAAQARNSAGQLHAVLLTPTNNLPLCVH
jgi:hypothetical protein